MATPALEDGAEGSKADSGADGVVSGFDEFAETLGSLELGERVEDDGVGASVWLQRVLDEVATCRVEGLLCDLCDCHGESSLEEVAGLCWRFARLGFLGMR